MFAINGDDWRLFQTGEADTGNGLEGLAEDGDPAALNDALTDLDGVDHVGVFNTPDGGDEPGPVLPGGSYRFTVPVSGERFSLATMFVQSNDWTFTTIDERPGFGPNQAPLRSRPRPCPSGRGRSRPEAGTRWHRSHREATMIPQLDR